MVGRETNIDHSNVNGHMGKHREEGLCVSVIFDRNDREMNGQSFLI